MKKVRLPLSLLFACAVSATGVFGATSTTTTSPAAQVYSDPLVGKQWQWNPSSNGIDIADVWEDGITGSGVVIGIIDAWVEWGHEDLNISPYNPLQDSTATGFSYDNGLSADFVRGLSGDALEEIDEDTEEREQVYTDENHGTFVAGMAAAIGGNDIGVVGAAPGATIAGLHIGDAVDIGYATTAAYWASGVSSTGTYTGEALIDVKNCSFGGSYGQSVSDVKTFIEAIERTSANNVIYVFAAGNERDDATSPGTTGWSSLGNSSSGINVAATNSSGTYADFSSYGSNIFISAPGDAVVSTDRTGDLGYNPVAGTDDDGETTSTKQSGLSNTNYASSKGTSFSAPIVAGVIALGKQICSPMDVRWAKWALAYSSGHDDAPNIDAVASGGTYVQASNIASSTSSSSSSSSSSSEETETTGDWQKNNGGYWFNNNYGFGLVNPVGFVETVRDIAYTTVETTASAVRVSKDGENSSETAPTTTTTDDVRKVVYNVSVATDTSTGGIGGGGTTTTTSVLTSTLETVSVTVNFSEDATELDLSSLKITLAAPGGTESVLVQGSENDPTKTISSLTATTDANGETVYAYTFLSNAFWGANYSSDTRAWKIAIEYDGITSTDMTDFVTVDSVDFTMGEMVKEEANLTVTDEVNAHALVLDSGAFTVSGTFNVEDSFLINAGTFNVDGNVGSVSDSTLDKGALFAQTGGVTNFNGSGTFERGVNIYGGAFNLNGSYSTESTGTVIYGGTFTVGGTSDTSAGSTSVSINGGNFVLANTNYNETKASFTTAVTLNSGTFVALTGSSMNTTLTVYGGKATTNGTSKYGVHIDTISVGKSAVAATDTTTEEAAKGGKLYIGGVLRASSVSFWGTGYGELASGGIIRPLEDNAFSKVSVNDSATFYLNGTTGEDVKGNGIVEICGDVSVAGGTLVWSGSLALTELEAYHSGTHSDASDDSETGTLVVSGTGTLIAKVAENGGETVLYTNGGATIDNGGTFYIGRTRVLSSGYTNKNYPNFDYGSDEENALGKLTVRQGASLVFTARSRSDYDYLDVSNAGLAFEEVDGSDANISFKYDFGNLIPHGNIELVRLKTKTLDEASRKVLTEHAAFELLVGNDIPTLVDYPKYALSNLFSVEYTESEDASENFIKTVMRDPETQDVITSVANLDLMWASQSTLQTAGQLTMRSRLLVARAAEKAGEASPLSSEETTFFEKVNQINYKSELLAVYSAVATPGNLIAIDELHDKQASAITGAISRRAREMRSGYIHFDTWSNPLFGNSGFSFSTNPNLVAAKGFVPYMLEDEDFPLMIWANGGYSFSEADDGAMSVSSTKSSLLNVAMGADFAVSEDFSLGLFAGFTNGRTKFDDGGRTEIQSRNVGVYAAFCHSNSVGSFFANAMAGAGFEEYDFKRKISVVGLDYTAEASPDGFQGIAYLEGGYEWKLGKWAMGPTLSLRYVNNDIDDYTESSSLSFLRQESDGLSYDSLLAAASWRVSYRADFEWLSMMPEVRVSWHHELLGTDEDFDMKMADGNIGYTSTVASTGDDSAVVGAGLTIMLGEVSTLSFDYDVQLFRDDADPVHSFNAMFRTRF